MADVYIIYAMYVTIISALDLASVMLTIALFGMVWWCVGSSSSSEVCSLKMNSNARRMSFHASRSSCHRAGRRRSNRPDSQRNWGRHAPHRRHRIRLRRVSLIFLTRYPFLGSVSLFGCMWWRRFGAAAEVHLSCAIYYPGLDWPDCGYRYNGKRLTVGL
ncbi:hypothetical protein GGR55DRAFT_651476 [Xylaria sp. FL0064]|nr:hypothetical protein GGR55DRAFT_651476 [Xylaria sp. FL0064]